MAIHPKKRKVLIVDDEESVISFLGDLLAHEDVEVSTATEIETAFLAIKREKFDLIITDLHLPGICGVDGLDLVRFVRDNNPKTNMMLITGDAGLEVEKEAYDSGACLFLRKPFNIRQLEDKLSSIGIILEGLTIK